MEEAPKSRTVKKIGTIDTIEDAERELDSISEAIKDLTAQEWEDRMEALKNLGEVVQKGIEIDNFIPLFSGKSALIAGLSTQLEDLRSTLCKEACNSIKIIAQAFEKDFEPIAPKLLPTLFKLLIKTIKIMAESANQCILSFLPFSFRSIPMFIENLSAQHPQLRTRCAEYIAATLELDNVQNKITSTEDVELLEGGIKKALADSTPAARTAAKKAYVAFKKHYPENAQKLLDSSDPSIQKILLAESGPTKSVSQFKNFRQQLKSKPVESISVDAANTISVAVAPAIPETPKEQHSTPFVAEPKRVLISAAKQPSLEAKSSESSVEPKQVLLPQRLPVKTPIATPISNSSNHEVDATPRGASVHLPQRILLKTPVSVEMNGIFSVTSPLLTPNDKFTPRRIELAPLEHEPKPVPLAEVKPIIKKRPLSDRSNAENIKSSASTTDMVAKRVKRVVPQPSGPENVQGKVRLPPIVGGPPPLTKTFVAPSEKTETKKAVPRSFKAGTTPKKLGGSEKKTPSYLSSTLSSKSKARSIRD